MPMDENNVDINYIMDVAVNKHSNMLIVGSGKTDFGLRDIQYFTDYDAVLSLYGESDISRAFKIASDMGVRDIFIMNLKSPQDYLSTIGLIKDNDFAYIVYVSLYLSDSFNQAYDGGKIHSYFAYFLGTIERSNESVLVVTDKHASLFETIDDFLEHQKSALDTFLSCCTNKANLENIVFVANNLENYPMANVVVAAALCTSQVNEYPRSNFGNAVFHIDPWDSPSDYAYFKSHASGETTIDNLLNCLETGEQTKLVFVSRIVKYIKRELDFSEFKGKLYTPYQKLYIEKKLEAYLESLVGRVINQYEIESVKAYRGVPGTVTILCRFSVRPIGCVERCVIEKEIDLM